MVWVIGIGCFALGTGLAFWVLNSFMAATVIGVLGALEERGALRLDRNKLEEGK